LPFQAFARMSYAISELDVPGGEAGSEFGVDRGVANLLPVGELLHHCHEELPLEWNEDFRDAGLAESAVQRGAWEQEPGHLDGFRMALDLNGGVTISGGANESGRVEKDQRCVHVVVCNTSYVDRWARSIVEVHA
jgi:hypothetical protein